MHNPMYDDKENILLLVHKDGDHDHDYDSDFFSISLIFVL